jgi:hypothetical protein
MARGNGTGTGGGFQRAAAAALAEPTSLEALRAALPPGQRKIVRVVVGHFERLLIEKLPELNAGVNTAQASGSFSATLQIAKAKKGRFAGKLSSRVRTPSEPIEIDLHLDDANQLTLGLPPSWDGGADAEAEE